MANINAITFGSGGNGGDFPEKGFGGTKQAVDGTAWRADSNRFVIAFADANFKKTDGATEANTTAALNANNTTFIGLDFGNMTSSGSGGVDPTGMANATGGAIYDSSTDPDEIVDSIGASFAEYEEVTVDDLGGGLPGVEVAVTCISADTDTCVGENAEGAYDRSITCTFEFDVTFTGAAEGDYSFDTYALVDGGIVATEADRISVSGGDPAIPVPAPLALVGIGLLAAGAVRRKHAA